MKSILLIIPILLAFVLLLRVFRGRIRQWLIQLRAKLQIRSLRTAIADADKDKKETNRKNLVVFNTVSGKFEPLQKKMLKRMAAIKEQPKVLNGYKQQKAVKKYNITGDKVKVVEKKSLYSTN